MKIGIVGLGLIGGSIFKSLKNHEIIAVSKSQRGKLANIVDDYNALSACEIVFVCTPISTTLRTLRVLEKYLDEKTIVCDVASVKEFVANEEFKFDFIPTHPMAGTENAGFEASFDGLFKGAKWVITQKKSESTTKLENLINELGATPIYANAKEHDEAVALISHMPAILSQAIFKAAESNQLALKLASSGFRDTTRLAISNVDMIADMINFNSQNIQSSVLKVISNLGSINEPEYKKEMERIKNVRQQMYVNGQNSL